MAVYFVTGKLGAGKTLMAVGRIKHYLYNGRTVATNLDLRLHKLLPKTNTTCRVIRLPDQPTLDDLRAIGRGNESYDEKLNGALVLDECGTWFNARNWNDKSRAELFSWFVHARKLGWDVFFIVQNMEIVDKQARLALGEMVVFCKRLDRLNVPYIGWVYKLIFGETLPLPKIHFGFVNYGSGAGAMVVDTWSCHGWTLYDAYDTKQAFSPYYDKGIYSYLPPGYIYRRSLAKKNMGFYMKLTKIVWRKYSRVAVGVAGCVAGLLVGFLSCLYFSPSISDSAVAGGLVEGQAVAAIAPAGAKNISQSVVAGNKTTVVDVVAQEEELPLRRLNYLLAGNKLRLTYDGAVYSMKTFPYPVQIIEGEPWGRVPVKERFQKNDDHFKKSD